MIAQQDNGQRRTIPYDYKFQFGLTGEPGRVHHSTVRVSVESNFVAVSIGYGIIVKRDPIRFGPSTIEEIEPAPNVINGVAAAYEAANQNRPRLTPNDLLSLELRNIPVGPIGFAQPAALGPAAFAAIAALPPRIGAPAAIPAPPPALPPPPAPPPGGNPVATWPPTLRDFRLSWISNSLRRALRENTQASLGTPRRGAARATDIVEVLARGVRFNPDVMARVLARGENVPLDPDDLAVMFEEIPSDAAKVQFLYALFDEGTGRAFQSDPILSTAGLGIEDGDRPFRQFAVPIVFEPRSAIRMDVIEKSDAAGELHVCLHGYRVLGAPGSPTDPRRAR